MDGNNYNNATVFLENLLAEMGNEIENISYNENQITKEQGTNQGYIH